MALTAKPALTVTIEYIDSSGSRGMSVTHLPAATLLAAAITKVDGLITLIDAASDCAIIGYSIAYGKIETAQPAPVLNSRVENKAKITFRTAAAKIAHFSWPDPTPAIVNPNGGLISTAAAMSDLVAALSGGANFTDSNGQFLTAAIADEQVFSATSVKQRTSDTSPAA
jgi:hypothetical protein